jgi:hypothetical protein
MEEEYYLHKSPQNVESPEDISIAPDCPADDNQRTEELCIKTIIYTKHCQFYHQFNHHYDSLSTYFREDWFGI